MGSQYGLQAGLQFPPHPNTVKSSLRDVIESKRGGPHHRSLAAGHSVNGYRHHRFLGRDVASELS